VTIVGDGTGATARAQVAGGGVVGLLIITPGSGYTKALVKFSGGNDAASADIEMFPFGVSGTAVETAFSRVWVTNGAAMVAGFGNNPPVGRTIFSSPGNPADFDPGNGAGAFKANDSFTRIGYYSLKQTNGFLYLIGDSSENYISGINTSSSGTPPVVTTTFQNLNSDPQIGTPWPSSVQVYQRNIVFANSAGVFVSYGGAVTKISDELDGFYSSSNQLTDTPTNFSSAIVDLYGTLRAYVLLLPIADPVTQTLINKLLIWNGKKWTTANQQTPLTFIASKEVNSVLSAWGTDGTKIVQLFITPTSAITKTAQSKLFSIPGIYYQKQMLHLIAVYKNYDGNATSVQITADNEVNSSAPIGMSLLPNLEFNVVGPTPLSNNGRMLGITVQTNAVDIALLGMTMVDQVFESNV
jgi:hypothetical protein